MKKIISLLLVFCLAVSLCACGGAGTGGSGNSGSTDNGEKFIEQTDPNYPVTMGLFYRNTVGADIVSDDPEVKAVDEKADKLLKEIEDAPDTIKVTGKTYYISADGDNKNDGLTPETARQSYVGVSSFLQPGDAVLFRRGDVFRGQHKLVSGVSYGAYGEGVKPRFYGSIDGKTGTWTESEEDIWTFNQSITDYSNIVFNNGEKVGRPVTKRAQLKKKELNVFYSGARISVYSPGGNPAEIFDSIEIVQGISLFVGSGGGTRDIKVENLCLMYAGVHGFGSLGYSSNVSIENCIIGFMGGKNLFTGQKSLGNAIEFMGGANNVTVRNNYLFQCYDTGITHQGPMTNSQSADFDNIVYDNNLIEYCVWGIESWIYTHGNAPTAEDIATGNTWEYGKVDITNNIVRYSGWGWGSLDRPDKNVYADIIYTNRNHTKPLTIKNNILDRSRKNTFSIQDGANKDLLFILDNTVIGAKNTNILGPNCSDTLQFEAEAKKYSNNVSGNTAKKLK